MNRYRLSNPNTENRTRRQASCDPPLTPTISVRVSGYAYVVELAADGSDASESAVLTRRSRPWHVVHKDRLCVCGDAACPAIRLVSEALKAGTLDRAPEPPPGFTPYLPPACPICGAAVKTEHDLSSRTRGIGWVCLSGRAAHYWQHKWQALKPWFFRDPLLPGLRRDDLRDGLPMGYLPDANRVRHHPTLTPRRAGGARSHSPLEVNDHVNPRPPLTQRAANAPTHDRVSNRDHDHRLPDGESTP